MKHLFIWLVWALVITGVCVAGDQLLLHSSLHTPILIATQTFYKDFRGRFILFVKKKDYRLKAVKEKWPSATLPAVREEIKPLPPPEPELSGYVYIDKDGGLHMTTRRDEVPKEYRATAKPLQK